jgi:signal peptidase
VQAAEWAVTIAVSLAILAAVLVLTGPRLLGWQGVIVLSGSMEPELRVGGLAFVDPDVGAADIEPGDIISFRAANGQRITHRVVETVRTDSALSFRTKGDANDDPDPDLVQAHDVLGRVRFDVPYAGYAAQLLRQRLWFYLLLGVPGGILVANEMASIVRELRSERRRAT